MESIDQFRNQSMVIQKEQARQDQTKLVLFKLTYVLKSKIKLQYKQFLDYLNIMYA